jgi:hypothetical protein
MRLTASVGKHSELLEFTVLSAGETSERVTRNRCTTFVFVWTSLLEGYVTCFIKLLNAWTMTLSGIHFRFPCLAIRSAVDRRWENDVI